MLIARCAMQRAELAQRVGQLKHDPFGQVLGRALGAAGGGRAPLRHPLAWVLGIAGLLLLRRPRQLLSLLGVARSAVSMAAKASVALQLLGQLRGTRARRPRDPERS